MEVESSVHSPSMDRAEDGITRQTAGYAPSVWGDYFIKHHYSPPSSSTSPKSEGWIRERVAELVSQAKSLLEDSRSNGDLKSLELIDSLERLGVGYHFEEEIERLLRRIHDDGRIDGDDLHAVSLRFRLLRQHGYNVKSEVFNKFKDDGGEFNGGLAGGARGLLCLYEACFLATHEEEDGILDEALSFARRSLRALSEAGRLDSAMNVLVSHALELPLHRRIGRLEARFYIAAREEDGEGPSGGLLELAKLDFHLLQLLHRQEARSLSIWWDEIVRDEKFKFSRDRIIECYFWILSVYYEPQYSLARKITTKVIALLSITDDTYDVYGTSDELRSFTDVIVRWDLEAANQLKEYMKIHFHNITKTFHDFEDELSSIGKSYSVHYLREILKVVARAWFEEVKWRDEGYVPTLQEHLQLTTVTTCYNLLSCASFMGMDDSATKEVFDWVLTFPKFTHHASVICRLRDDVTSHELEQKRLHVASAVQCHMKEHNSSLEKTCEELLKMVEDEWKSMNQEYLSLSVTFPRAVLTRILNFARVMETTYDVHDKYTHSSLIKDRIYEILVEPIPL